MNSIRIEQMRNQLSHERIGRAFADAPAPPGLLIRVCPTEFAPSVVAFSRPVDLSQLVSGPPAACVSDFADAFRVRVSQMAEAIYLLCAITSLVAAVLLLRQYQARRTPLLLWSCIGFFGLALNNVLVFTDFALLTGTDLSLARAIAGVGGILTLLYGLIWEAGR
jgi:hypothetical protein